VTFRVEAVCCLKGGELVVADIVGVFEVPVLVGMDFPPAVHVITILLIMSPYCWSSIHPGPTVSAGLEVIATSRRRVLIFSGSADYHIILLYYIIILEK